MSDKIYIMNKCDNFTRQQNITILKFLIELNVKISQSADGSRINLDTLTDKQVEGLKSKINELDVPIDPIYQI
jgi:hypothetical protein